MVLNCLRIEHDDVGVGANLDASLPPHLRHRGFQNTRRIQARFRDGLGQRDRLALSYEARQEPGIASRRTRMRESVLGQRPHIAFHEAGWRLPGNSVQGDGPFGIKDRHVQQRLVLLGVVGPQEMHDHHGAGRRCLQFVDLGLRQRLAVQLHRGSVRRSPPRQPVLAAERFSPDCGGGRAIGIGLDGNGKPSLLRVLQKRHAIAGIAQGHGIDVACICAPVAPASAISSSKASKVLFGSFVLR